MNPTLVRIAPWLVLLVVAYGAGRWQGRKSAGSLASSGEQAAASATSEGVGSGSAASGSGVETPPSRAEVLLREFEVLHAAARGMPTPDARTYAFFENLELADMSGVVDQILALPAGNEQDLFFIMAIRRWAELDGPGALAATSRLPALATRRAAELGAWEAWGSRGATAAMARAGALAPGQSRDRIFASILSGAATVDPRQAFDLWQAAPADFRDAALGPVALNQIVAAAYGTGKREAMQALIAGLPADATRDRMAAALCGEWGGHYPDEALRWLETMVGTGPVREEAMGRVFDSLLQKDPALAATWGSAFPDPRRRASMISSAVSNWVELNPAEAELWINEQADSPELDGATFAMAAHFIGARDLPRAYAWICRIRQSEARSELLGNLGRAWSRENPAGFQQFLEERSLNRAEIEMLRSKIDAGE